MFLDMGAVLSIPGTVTYKNSELAEVVRYVPLDRLLSETDAPFLTPQPKRGKRNEPAFVKLVVEEIARIKQRPIEEIGSCLAQNLRSHLHAPSGRDSHEACRYRRRHAGRQLRKRAKR